MLVSLDMVGKPKNSEKVRKWRPLAVKPSIGREATRRGGFGDEC